MVLAYGDGISIELGTRSIVRVGNSRDFLVGVDLLCCVALGQLPLSQCTIRNITSYSWAQAPWYLGLTPAS